MSSGPPEPAQHLEHPARAGDEEVEADRGCDGLAVQPNAARDRVGDTPPEPSAHADEPGFSDTFRIHDVPVTGRPR
jgi:hypothetical protein